jgi:hypothetical protein
MESSLNLFDFTSNQTFIVITLCFAILRIYLELINFKFEKLPISKKMSQKFGQNHLNQFHRNGLIFSVGYVLLFAPAILLA